LAVVEFLADDKSEAWAEVLEALDGRWTTVDRVLNAGPFSETLGVVIDPKTSTVSFGNGDLNAGGELLKRVLTAMAAPGFEFADIEDKDDRKRFIDQFVSYNVRAAPGAAAQPATSQGSPAKAPEEGFSSNQSEGGTSDGSSAAPAAAPPAPPSDASPADATPPPSRRGSADANRKTLAPSDGPRVLPVQGIRLVPLYNECRKLKVKNNENAAAFLVRVFVELSSENYLQEKNVPLPPSLQAKSITEWEDYKVKLSDKIAGVMYHIDPSKKAPVFLQARAAILKESVGSFSINMLHSYFHNRHVLPDEETIKASWDGWEAYLRELYTALRTP